MRILKRVVLCAAQEQRHREHINIFTAVEIHARPVSGGRSHGTVGYDKSC